MADQSSSLEERKAVSNREYEGFKKHFPQVTLTLSPVISLAYFN